MTRAGLPPTADEIAEIPRATLDGLPRPFTEYLADIPIRNEEIAGETTLETLGIDQLFDLTGHCEGLQIHEKDLATPGAKPVRITLYPRAVLDEWIEENENLRALVRHIVIHQTGYPLGLSGKGMHGLEDQS